MTAALQALLDRVEGGEFPADTSARDLGIASDGLPIIKTMYSAFSGSLDAAKALHEAVLPDRSCGITFGGEYGATVTFPPTWDDMHLSVSNAIPARAWLIAIIRALIAASVAENEGGV